MPADTLSLASVRVILVRHAKAAPGSPTLSAADPAGQEAARLLGDLLAERQPDAVVSSPYLRARETAEAIAAAAASGRCRRAPRAGRRWRRSAPR